MPDASTDAVFLLWKGEIDRAIKRDRNWHVRGRKIIRRYRDERNDTSDSQTAARGTRRFNILWSNVQTLLPSLYSRMPEPIVERRFLDHDPFGRVASTILERGLKYELEDNGYHNAIKAAVLDYLLPGRGQVWVRFEPAPGVTDEGEISPEQTGGSPYDDENGIGTVGEPKGDAAGAGTYGATTPSLGHNGGPPLDEALECVPVDYVNWQDFLTSQARVWSEVTWVARRVWMGRSELKQRWPKIADKIPLERPRDDSGRYIGGTGTTEGDDALRKAEIFEIWCKETKEVHFLCKSWDRMIETVPDPLHLKDFWPCPEPIRATTTHDTIEPVPDYVEYQDQAEELDRLTARIASLLRSLKVAGAYDASASALGRILDEGVENKLVPVENWAAFAEKGGIEGAITWLPIRDVAGVLAQLFEARAQIKQDLYEITGIADIIRGQSDPRETLGAQKIKGGFATQRLSSRQIEVARFARDVIAIVAEIMAEHWSAQSLVLASSILQDDGLGDMPVEPAVPTAPTGPSSGMGMPGEPPLSVPASPPDGTAPAPAPPPDPQVIRMQMVAQAIALLRNQKLRGFRVDIETDSTISQDAQEDKQARVEFTTALGGLLEQAIAGGQQFPPVISLAGKVLQWTVRGFRVGRDLEAAVDEFIEQAGQFAQQAAAQGGGQPDPEQQKAALALQQQQFEMQKQQAQFAHDQEMQQLEAQKAVMEFKLKEAQAMRDEQIAQAEHQRKMAEMGMGMMATQEQTRAKIAAARSMGNGA